MSALAGTVPQTQGLLDEGRASVACLDMDLSALTRWETAAAELNASLQNLVEQAQSVSPGGNTEQGVTGVFQ